MFEPRERNFLLTDSKFIKHREYWESKLSGEITETRILSDDKENNSIPDGVEKKEILFPNPLNAWLMKASKGLDLSIYILLLAGLKVLIRRYTESDDIIVISPVYKDRVTHETFNDYILIRDFLTGDMVFKEFLFNVRQSTLEGYDNQDYPLDELVEYLARRKQIPGNKKISSILCELRNIHAVVKDEAIKDKLVFSFIRESEHIRCTILYQPGRYDRFYIEQISHHLLDIFESLIQGADVMISRISLLSQEEKQQLIYDFNNVPREFRGAAAPTVEVTLNKLFEEQVFRSPDHMSIVYGEQNLGGWVCQGLTYKRLNERANQLARHLKERGVRTGSIVAVMVKPSLDMFTAIWAILKAGGAYLPIDTNYPENRISFILKDSQVGILLTQHGISISRDFEGEPIEVDEVTLYSGPAINLRRINTARDMVYIIYTSGTTGTPKGVIIEQRNVTAYLSAFYNEFPITSKNVVLQQASYSFDAFVEETYPVLLKGGRIAIPPVDVLMDIPLLCRFILDNDIDLISCSPLLLNELNNAAGLGSIHTFISGADVLKKEYVSNLLKRGSVYNTYGPTETTVCASYYRCRKDSPAYLPIGKPIINYWIYILDKNGSLLPVGAAGEICISGAGVGRGYLNQGELTQKKFVSNPFVSCEVMYKSGDLGRWLPDGNIEFLGRSDDQIKLRGFRIEPGEIESCLMGSGNIQDVIVMVKEDNHGDKYLIAYFLPRKSPQNPVDLSIPGMREYLLKHLPAYMVPSYFIPLEAISLTLHGKVDRNALPDPWLISEAAYVAPRDEIEKKLLKIWSEVLGIDMEEIGIDANFFESGGHSLKATILISRIFKVFNVKIPFSEIFEISTVRGLAKYIKGSVKDKYLSIKAVEKKEFYELSSAQKRLYILQQMDIESTVYNIPAVIFLPGRPNIVKLEKTFKQLISQHESLRTSFHMMEDQPVQKVHEKLKFGIGNYKGAVEAIIKDFVQPFDLSQAPLLRVGVIKAGDERYQLMVDMHHIIADGISTDLLEKDFVATYEERVLPRLRIQYKDFTQWQNSRKQCEIIREQEKYWLQEFEGEIPVLNLPVNFMRPSIQSFEGDSVNFEISPEICAALKTAAAAEGATLFMALLSVLNVFLSKLSTQEVIIVGTPIAGRKHMDLEKIIGMFVNTLALKNYSEGYKTFKGFLREVKKRTLDAFENQDYQFEDLVERLSLNLDASRNPLFDVMFTLNTIEEQSAGSLLEGIGHRYRRADSSGDYNYKNLTAKFDLTIIGEEVDEKLLFTFQYCTKLFTRETINWFTSYFKRIISFIVTEPDAALWQIEFMPPGEKKRILYDFNDTGAGYPGDKTLQQLFELQTDNTPYHIAVVFHDRKLTYQELNRRSNQLARALRANGVREETIVGILLERGLEMMISILAVLKADGTYLPLDCQYPVERIKFILRDSNAELLLTRNELCTGMKLTGSMMGVDDEEIYRGAGSNTKPGTTPGGIAYIIYTSGSSGVPRGVMIEHFSVINLTYCQKRRFGITGWDRILQFSSFSFDASVEQIFIAFFSGACLVLVDRGTLMDGESFEEFICNYSITHIHAVPSFLKTINPRPLMRLKRMISGGDSCPIALADRWSRRCEFYNEYGPTETTVTSIEYLVENTGEWLTQPPIGKGLANTRVYILDRWEMPVPPRVPGELYIGGDGVARGYLNKPELTWEKFIPNPFSAGERYYRTGDRCRWLPDGNIEFLCRLDQQVKIRGFRIELEEIQGQLLKHPAVKEAVVLARQEGDREGTLDKYLCAYVVLDRSHGKIFPGNITLSEGLRNHLSQSLPDYMIPMYFTEVEEIPLTPIGKVDQKALPVPYSQATEGYIAPRDTVEDKLVGIWSDVLGLGKDLIGIDSNFFKLGGHSLKAIILIARIHKELNIRIPLPELFKTPFVRGLAGYIRESVKNKYSSIEPVEKKEYYRLSSAQKRLYVLQQMELESTVYNISEVIPLAERPDMDKLSRIFIQLLERHESLRTSFTLVGEEPVQVVRDNIKFGIGLYSAIGGPPESTEETKETGGHENEPAAAFFSPQALTGLLKSIIRPFVLSEPPLFRVGVIKTGRHPSAPPTEAKYFLVVDMHHIITDGISNGILARDFKALGAGRQLPPLRIQYKDFSQWQNNEREKEYMKSQGTYWLKEFEGEIPVLNIPTDFPRPEVQSFEGNHLHFEISMELAGALEKIALGSKATLFMVLLTVYYLLLSKVSGQEDIVIGTVVAGRRHADLEPVIGMFVNTLAIRNYPLGEKTFVEFLGEIKKRTLEAFENQDWQFEDLVEVVAPNRGIKRNPLFDAAFGFQHMEGEKEEKKNTQYEYEPGVSKFDLSFYGIKKGGHLDFTVGYGTKLFNQETIERFIGYFKQTIASVITSNRKLANVEIVSEEEKKQILYDFNHPNPEHPGDKTLDVLFTEQAARVAGEIAVGNYLNLTPIYDELASETIHENMLGKLEKCRFQKNPYVFRFEDKTALMALELFEKKELAEMVLLKTHRENYIAVNRAVLLFLEYLDGQSDLKSLFNVVNDKLIEFRMYPVVIDLDTGFISGERNIFLLNQTFSPMVLLIKALYRANLIELVDYGSASPKKMIDWVYKEPGKVKEEMESSIKESQEEALISCRNKIDGTVLLLGDRASTASTGLLYIASFLRRNGIEAYCQWNDFSKTTAQLKANVEKLLLTYKPKVVGVSMKWFPHIARVLEICKIIKHYDPLIRVVVGGNTASYYKEQVIQNEYIDYVIKGDGEVPFLKICLGDDDIPNCIYKKDGKIIETPITYIQDETNSSDVYLSHLDQIFVSKKDPYLVFYFYINTGKGCSMPCFYCGGCLDAQKKAFNRNKPFMRGVNEVRKDLMEARKYTSTFFFDFDLPTYDSVNYYKEIWEGIDFSQHFCEFYFWKLPTIEFLDYVVKVFKYVYINIDLCSLSQPHRQKLSASGLVKPQPTDEELFDFFNQCEKYGNVEVYINHIIGLPYFSYDDIEISRLILEKLLKRYSCFKKMDWARLHAQPGAPLTETSEKYGMHSHAKTYKDFLYYSQLNLMEEIYPELLTYHYPYIYANDDRLNSEISRFYAQAEQKVEESIKKKRRNLSIVHSITYEELEKKSNQLARILQERGAKGDSIVAFCVERSPEMIIGLLAILKAKAAYLPLDPNYREKRLEYMLKDSNASILLTQEDFITGFENLVGFEGTILNIMKEEIYIGDSAPLEPIHPLHDLAYVMYTSGSTGKPKAVMVEHQNVLRLVKNCNFIDFTWGDKLLLTGATVFDITTFEIWGSLLNGVLLFLVAQDLILDGDKLGEILSKNNISILHLIPQLFNRLADKHIDIFSGLKYLLVGGDIVHPQYINRVRNRYKELKILHLYGPTENTTFSTFLPVDKDYNVTIPIGKPITRSTAFIINKDGQFQPIGIAGELYVGGDGVSRGYLNNPELTAEKFKTVISHWSFGNSSWEKLSKVASKHSYKPSANDRFYQTGDLAKWLPDGNIEFLGRIDQQVKVRGQRIELGEIESQLLKHEEIKATVVLDRKDKDGEKYLCAYIVPRSIPVSSVSLSVPALREYLSSYLPDYMIPSRFVFIEKVPLNINGKIDRKALPDPEIISSAGYASPRNELEKGLVEIWSNVLGIEAEGISIDADFFELGGHSLKATILISKLHQTFNVKIKLIELFKTPTIKGLTEYMQGLTSYSDEMRFSSIEPVEEREYYPLSSAQKRLYVLQQMELGSTSYNIPITLVLEGLTDKGKLEECLRKLIARHEILRTSVELIDEEPVQKIHDQVQFEIEYHDPECKVQSAEREEGRQALYAAYCASTIKDFIRPFDLFQAPLLRGGLIKTDDKEHILIIDIHHIVSDATSMEILLKEFITLYSNRELPSFRLRYKDYSEWQNSDGQKAAIKNQEEYWLKQFKGDIPVLDLPYDYPRPAVQSIAGSQLEFKLLDEPTRKLKDLALDTGTTLYIVLLAIFNILLSKISGQEDIVVGTPVAGRRHADIEKIMGMFVNTLAMRNYPGGAKTFRHFLKEVKETTLEAFENQEYQFEDLVEHVSVQRDTSRNPLFDVMFMVANLGASTGNIPAIDTPGLKIKPYERENTTSKFDMNLTAWEAGLNLVFNLQYCTKLFKKATIERFITYFTKIVSLITKETNTELRQIEIISEEEKQQVLYRFNNTQKEYPKDKTTHKLFEDQAERTPTHLAVTEVAQEESARSPEKTLTYWQLNKKSNQLARILRQNGVRQDTIVSIMLDRSLEMIIGIMAVLKAGGAYLPIDPGSSPNRMQLMLNDSKAGQILATTPIAAKVEPNKELILLDNPGIYQGDHSNFEYEIGMESLAYVIYTSGTTGNPKGVLIPHRGLVNYIWWAARTYVNGESVNFPLYTSLSFDLTVTSIFTPLITGNAIIIYQGDQKENLIEKIIEENKVGIIKLTPSHLKLIRNKKLNEFNFLTPGNGVQCGIKRMIVGGEKLETKLAIDIESNFNGSIEIYNEYGPTETVVGSMIHQFNRHKDTKESVLIGMPINNTQVYLVDQHLKPVPVGVVGEIYVAGNGVARGYLNKPGLTAEKFVRNPYDSDYKRAMTYLMYRTGDLARRYTDGNIEFLGRIDHQVKIRGFRIELAEIENRLLRQKRIKEAVVIEREGIDGDQYLCAYIVCNQKGLTDQKSYFARELKEYLSDSLPDYMIPLHIMEIEAIPLTASGKIDRNALPEPGIKPGEEYIAPKNKLEETLVNIWAEILKLPQDVIGIGSNFFDLGGHSIRATQLTAKIDKELGVKIPLLEIFKSPYIRSLARYINDSQPGKYEIINTIEKKEYYPLSSAQRGVYVQHQKERGRTSYNMPQAIILDFNVDMERLKQTFNKLIQRHESLRTSFEMIGDEPVQRVHHHVELEIEYHTSGDSISTRKIIKDFLRPFELTIPPVLRVGIIKTQGNENILLMDIHHIITDGISTEIFNRDVIALYNGEPLPPLRIQYKDYIAWQNRREIVEKTKKQRDFWLKEFEGEIPVINMPYDFERPVQRSYEGRIIEFVIGEKLCNALREMSRQTETTLYMILMATYNLLLYRYTWQEDIIVGSPVTGRRHADLENIIGMFVNIMAIRNRPQGGKTFKQFLREVKDKVLDALENQDYYFEELVVELGCQGNVSRNPLFDVVFSMAVTDNESQGQEGADDSHRLKTYKFEFQITPFDLILAVVERVETIEMNFSYSTALFNRSTIEMMAEHFMEILNQIVASSEIKLRDIRISHHLITTPSAIVDKDLEEFEF